MTCTMPQPRTREPAESVPAVRLEGLSKWLDERPVLREIVLQVPQGQFLAILGANGAGKSTLLKVLALLSGPTEGRLELFGHSVGRGTAAALRRRIGLIGHQTMLYRQLTARENLMFFARLYELGNARQRCDEMLEMVRLERRADEPVKCFSRGMSQRLAIARALLHDPELLLADEPFSGLDAAAAQTLEELLLSLNQAGKTILLVHHDIVKALRLAARAIVLREGYVVIDELAGSLGVKDVLAEVTEQ